jgi:hypothetical protein
MRKIAYERGGFIRLVGVFHQRKKRRLLATARAHDATLWTQDAHFKDVEGVKYIEKKV